MLKSENVIHQIVVIISTTRYDIKFKRSKLWTYLPPDIKEIQSCSSSKHKIKDYSIFSPCFACTCTLHVVCL